jgi:hypothetical protein
VSLLTVAVGPLRHELGEDHEYEFVEAIIRCAPAKGMPPQYTAQDDLISSDAEISDY